MEDSMTFMQQTNSLMSAKDDNISAAIIVRTKWTESYIVL